EVTKGQTGQRQEAVRTCGLLDVEFHSSEAIWSQMVSSDKPGVAISANEAAREPGQAATAQGLITCGEVRALVDCKYQTAPSGWALIDSSGTVRPGTGWSSATLDGATSTVLCARSCPTPSIA